MSELLGWPVVRHTWDEPEHQLRKLSCCHTHWCQLVSASLTLLSRCVRRHRWCVPVALGRLRRTSLSEGVLSSVCDALLQEADVRRGNKLGHQDVHVLHVQCMLRSFMLAGTTC
jgi:hypothetical protein